MWCGNVPTDASQEELWRFFTQTTDSLRLLTTPLQSAPQDTHGVLSIFLMSRSNCAFVNFSSARHLDRACSLFHGTKLRYQSNNDPPVCRARRLEDVEHAGVAAQRGKGVHTSWYRKEKQQQKPISEEANDRTLSSKSGDSVSFSSTDSSLLSQPQFAHRFFILKSRNSEALKTALRTNIWSTQTHNESVLDQAFRKSEKVTLLFSENHSGHFFGYATMAVVNTEPLPFRKINKLRNPWRDNRLVKVSRDGTELEPNVGRQLLSIWESTT
ncbi:hypothetical protein MYAM1_003948 [Malassezia yamatoensis]|uniref:YTH domain-containing protein n=1 Tax=Malassezia yamatoensis TaxID=253288 RepID=A0AAJ6CJF8_9BASI|nr:hypothetical protein MYAM1_003948 [Malassezia yamatoensis]